MAAGIVALEAVALVASGGFSVVQAIDASAPPDVAVALGALALLVGVALGWASWALVRGKTWPRGLAITWQLLQLAAGWVILDVSAAAGVATIALALAAAVALVLDVRARPSL